MDGVKFGEEGGGGGGSSGTSSWMVGGCMKTVERERERERRGGENW